MDGVRLVDPPPVPVGELVDLDAQRRKPRAREGWKDRFIAALGDTASVTAACKAAGVDRSTAYRARREDSGFAVRWATCEAEVTETLERVAVKRAIEGSDLLVMFLLKARRPHTYRDRTTVQHQHAHVHGTLEDLLGGRNPADLPPDVRRQIAGLLDQHTPPDATVIDVEPLDD